MRLKPFKDNSLNPILNPTEFEIIPAGLDVALEEAGLASKKQSQDIANARKIFDSHGAGINDIAQQVSDIMRSGESENSRLRACEIALEVQGILKEVDETKIPEININIIGSENKAIINLIMPQKDN